MAPRYRKTADRCLFTLPRIRAYFPFFPVSSSAKPQLPARNEKAPLKGDLRKAYKIPRGFRGIHAILTPYSRPPLPVSCFSNRRFLKIFVRLQFVVVFPEKTTRQDKAKNIYFISAHPPQKE